MGLYENWVNQWTSGMNQSQKEGEYNKALEWLKSNLPGFVESNSNDPSNIYRRYIEATTAHTDPRWSDIPRTQEEQAYQNAIGQIRKYSPATLEGGKTTQELLDFGNRISNYFTNMSKTWNLGHTGQSAEEAVQKWVDDQNYWDNENKRIASLWDADALRALQYTYSPDVIQRRQAVEYLNKKLGTAHWNAIAPHVMETGNLLGEELPDFLKSHTERYLGIKEQGELGEKRRAEALDKFGRERYYDLVRKTYSRDVEDRRAAVAELTRGLGENWKLYANAGWQNPFAVKKSFVDLVKESLAGARASDNSSETASNYNSNVSTGNTASTGATWNTGNQGLRNTTGEFNQAGTDWINYLLKLAGLL